MYLSVSADTRFLFSFEEHELLPHTIPDAIAQQLLLLNTPVVTPQQAQDFLLSAPSLFDRQRIYDHYCQHYPDIRDSVYRVSRPTDPCSPHWKWNIIFAGQVWSSREHALTYVKLQHTSDYTQSNIRAIVTEDLMPRQVWHMGLINSQPCKLLLWQRHCHKHTHNILVVSALLDKKLLKSLLYPEIVVFDCTRHNQDCDQRGFLGQENEMGDTL